MTNQYPPPHPGNQQPAPPQVVYVQAPKKKRGFMKKVMLGLGALLVLIIVASALAGTGDDAASTDSSEGARTIGDVQSGSSRTPIEFDTIISDTEGMTDLQFDQYADDAKRNRRADRWTATVTEVDDQIFGSGFYAHLTVNPGDTFDFYDISIDIPEDVALTLNLGDELVFSGEIKDLTNTLDLTIVDLENVTIHSQVPG